MNFTARSITVGLAVAALGALSAPAFALPTDAQANPLADFQTNNNGDPFSGGNNANSNVMNLMHRIMLSGDQDPTTFAEAQQSNMNDAMANFRAKQMQLIKARQAKTQAPTAIQPGVVQNCQAASILLGTTCVNDPQTGNAVIMSLPQAATEVPLQVAPLQVAPQK